MAKPESKRISSLDTADPLTGAEQLALTQNERTVRATMQAVKSFADSSCQCTLVSRYTNSCTSAVTFEEFLETYILPANTLSTNGSYLDIYITGTFDANATTKTLTFRFGANLVTLPVKTYNSVAWFLKLKIQRATATLQRITGYWETVDDVVAAAPEMLNVLTEPTENLLTDTTLSISGTNGTANEADICLASWIVDLHLLDTNS